jgi:hypothetical protein
MRRTYRFALVAVASLAALGFASSAFATFAPKLVVSSSTPQGAGSGGSVRLGVVVANVDDPTARVQIYIPSGYQVASPAAGTKLGSVTATASAADLGGAILPLTGELDAIAPNATAAAQCGVTAAQTWDMHLTAAGQTLDIPLYVVASSAPEAAAGYPTKLVVCLPPPDVPAGTPGRAVFGAKLLSAQFDASAITEPVATGDFRWTSLWTPYTPLKGTPNAAATVETQAIRHIPTQVTQTVTKKKLTSYRTIRRHGKKVRLTVIRTQVKFSATVDASGAAPASASISTTAAGKRVGAASGSFILAAGKSATVTATALVNHAASVPTGQAASAADLFYADLGGTACTPTTIFGGLPCVDATVGGQTIKASKVVVGYRR